MSLGVGGVLPMFGNDDHPVDIELIRSPCERLGNASINGDSVASFAVTSQIVFGELVDVKRD